MYYGTLQDAARDVAEKLSKAAAENPKIMKDLSRAATIPMYAGTAIGAIAGMSSDEHKLGNTIWGMSLGSGIGSLGGMAAAAAICKTKYKLF